jgi:hypothetical protein
MKRLIYSLVLFGFLFAACEGPAGPQGAVGPVGPQGPAGANGVAGATGTAGKDGTNGKDGKDGTSATARYYDFTQTWTGSLPGSVENYYLVKPFNKANEYILVYLKDGSFYTPLPIKGGGYESDGKTLNIVDFRFSYAPLTSAAEALLFVDEWNYAKNGASSYSFRVIVAPMVAGGRLSANTPYEVVKKKYNLPD